jgi:hypothetical protein
VILLITYELQRPERDTTHVERLLKTAASWIRPFDSAWLIESDEDPKAWRDRLREVGDVRDEFLVVRVGRSWASRNVDAVALTWLRNAGRRW